MEEKESLETLGEKPQKEGIPQQSSTLQDPPSLTEQLVASGFL